MIYDGRGRNYIFGKTFMDSHEVAKWLEIDEFVAGIDDLRNSSQDINDATVLCLMNRIIEKHSDDSDETFPLDWASDDKELGYVTRFKNETIARLMDFGKVFHAYVDEPPEPPKDETEARRTRAATENYRLPFSIYMDE